MTNLWSAAWFASGCCLIHCWYHTSSKESISYSGGYGFVSFFLTDNMCHYDHKDAEFARVTPTASSGAWEVAARYSAVDMNDEDAGEMNGSSKSVTLGVNYNPNVKLMLNYGHVNNDEFATGKNIAMDTDHPDLQAVKVHKHRFGYMVNDTICEVAEVLINGARVVTINSESTEIEDILKILELTGLTGVENINYLQAIKRVIGWIDKDLAN